MDVASVARIILLIVEGVKALVRHQAEAERKAAQDAIRADPVGEFKRLFGAGGGDDDAPPPAAPAGP